MTDNLLLSGSFIFLSLVVYPLVTLNLSRLVEHATPRAKDATPRTVPCAMPACRATGAMDLVTRQFAEQCIVPFNVSSAAGNFLPERKDAAAAGMSQTHLLSGSTCCALWRAYSLCRWAATVAWMYTIQCGTTRHDALPLARHRAGAGQLDLSTAPKQLCAVSAGAAGARGAEQPCRSARDGDGHRLEWRGGTLRLERQGAEMAGR